MEISDQNSQRQGIPVLRDPVLRICELARSSDHRHIIGLSGVPGAGKSTLATRWSEEIINSAGPEAFTLLGLDGFHLSKAELRRMPDPENAFARRGAPWTFNPVAIARKLRALHTGFGMESVEWPGFEHGVGDPVEGAVVVKPEVRVILVEGIYTACPGSEWEAVRDEFDEQWYLDVPWEDAAPRLIARHISSWNMSTAEATRRADSNDRINAKLVQKGRSRADWLIIPERRPGAT